MADWQEKKEVHKMTQFFHQAFPASQVVTPTSNKFDSFLLLVNPIMTNYLKMVKSLVIFSRFLATFHHEVDWCLLQVQSSKAGIFCSLWLNK